MYYLKCENCGHLNELKTEYLTFCTSCKKKMTNNFTEWKKRNPGKSFEDYKQLMCISEDKIQHVTETKKPKVKDVKYWVGFIIAFAIFYAIGELGGEKIIELFRGDTFDRALMTVASEINKSCPIMVDNATRLDNAIALPGKTLQYNYTLINMLKDSVDTNKLKNSIEPILINYIKTNPGMKDMRDQNTTLKYYYKDMTGKYLFTITVKPEQYE